jgi:hypothetical protein
MIGGGLAQTVLPMRLYVNTLAAFFIARTGKVFISSEKSSTPKARF